MKTLKKRVERLRELVERSDTPNLEERLEEWIDLLYAIIEFEKYPKTHELLAEVDFKVFYASPDLRNRVMEVYNAERQLDT